MKILTVLLVLLSINCFSQTETGSHTLLSTKPDKQNEVNTYLSIDGSWLQLNKEDVGSVGLTLGVTTNKCFTFGLIGNYIFDSPNDNDQWIFMPDSLPAGKNVRIYCGYGGILLEPTLFPKFPIHLTFPVSFCVGNISYYLKPTGASYWSKTNGEYLGSYTFFMINLGVRLELNVIRNMRITCGPSYHWIPSQKISPNPDYQPSGLLSSLSLDFSIKIGNY